jgi:hypothetical protein
MISCISLKKKTTSIKLMIRTKMKSKMITLLKLKMMKN